MLPKTQKDVRRHRRRRRRRERPAGYPADMARLHLPGRKTHQGSAGAREPEVPGPQEVGPGPEVEREAPDRPSKLPPRAWGAVVKGTLREFQADELGDRAAA